MYKERLGIMLHQLTSHELLILHLHPQFLSLLQLFSDAKNFLSQELVVGFSAGGCLKYGLLHLHGILDEPRDSWVLENTGNLGKHCVHSACV